MMKKTLIQQDKDEIKETETLEYLPHSLQIYQPQKDDYIIGILKKKIYEGWLVDIMQQQFKYAFLPKNNVIKETIQKEYYIFCQIKQYQPQQQIQLKFNQKTCQIFQQNDQLHIFKLPISQCQELIQNKQKQLIIAKRIKFEIYIGLNGVIILDKVNDNEANIIRAALINQIPVDELDQFIRDQMLI